MYIDLGIVLILLIAVTAGAVFFINKSAKNKNQPAGGFGGGFGRGPQTATAVRTVIAKNRTITDFVYTNGAEIGITTYKVDMEEMVRRTLKRILHTLHGERYRRGLSIVEGYLIERESVKEI